MAPHVNLFGPFEASMRFIGMFRRDSGVPQKVTTFLKFLSVLGSFFFQLSMFAVIIFGDEGFYTRLEMLTITLLASALMYRQILIVWKEKEVLSLIKKMNALLEEVEVVYGEETLFSWEGQCRRLMYVYAAVVSSVAPTVLIAYYKHYIKGVTDAIPYEAYTPFDKATQFNSAVMFQVATFYSPGLTIVVSNTFIGTVSIAVAGVLNKISDQYTQITSSTVEVQLKNTIQWHSNIIRIVDEFNSLFGSAILIDYLLAMVYLCISAFLLVKAGNDDDATFYKYVLLMVDYLAISLSCYLFGHRVSVASDTLARDIVHNEWYLLSPKQRKDMIFPIVVASKGLSFNFRNCVYFDLTAYLAIVRQSYSFLTLLRLMDNQN